MLFNIENTKTIIAATRHGVLSQGRKGKVNKKPLTISPDQYDHLESPTIGSDLSELQEKVRHEFSIDGFFDYKSQWNIFL